MDGTAVAGTACLNEQCAEYGTTGSGNLVRFGRTKGGVQRWRCKICGITFVPSKGTVFYGLRTPPQRVLHCLVLLAEGVRISSISRATGVKEDTILAWLRRAALHAEALEERLLRDYKLSRVQIDGLWAYVGHKGPKGRGGMLTVSTRASSGAQR